MNPVRGEVTLTLCGKDYILRPTFEALIALERKLGVGLATVIGRFEEKPHPEIRLEDLAVIAWAGILGAGEHKLSYNEVGTLVMRTGIQHVTKPLIQFVYGACTAGAEEGKVPETATPETKI
jgi:hypothetical protein